MTDKQQSIRENIARIQAEIADAATHAGRDPKEVTLIAASKTQSSESIRTAIAAGISVCGENRVQELLPHLEDNAYAGAEVHFIGHLQTNKVKQVVGAVSLIHSVDSVRLLDEIEKQAKKQDLTQDILFEINIGHEENKGGTLPEHLPALVEHAKTLPHIRLCGLMCIPPADATDRELLAFFQQMQALLVDTRAKMGDNTSNVTVLSMGMSSDFALAIEAGATMVRVGTALFGARPPLSTV